MFTPIAIGFIAYFCWLSRLQLKETFQQAKPIWLIISISLWILLHFISPLFTIALFKRWQLPLDYSKAFWIHSSRLPAKYLPGGIWHSVARAADYHKHGINKNYLGSYLLIENLLVASVTMALGGSIIINIISEPVWLLLIKTIIIFSICIIVLLPWLIDKHLLSICFSSPKYYYAAVSIAIIYWLTAASSFVCFLKAFPELDLAVSYLISGGIYIFSWSIGFIALFAPQGIGVAEFISSKLLSQNHAGSYFIALLTSFRLVALIGDSTTYGLLKLMSGKRLECR